MPDYYIIKELHIYLKDVLCPNVIELSRYPGYYNLDSDNENDKNNQHLMQPKIKKDKILYTFNSKWISEFIENKYLDILLTETRFIVFEEHNYLKWTKNEQVISITEIIKHERIEYD